jgi:hypothetical protein
MHSIENLLLSRRSIGIGDEANATQSEETDETDKENENEREEKCIRREESNG